VHPKKCHFVSTDFLSLWQRESRREFSSIFEKKPKQIFVILRSLGTLELGPPMFPNASRRFLAKMT
jgi:hypothetical protein